jgi:membrane-associated phospholipid phosphatase
MRSVGRLVLRLGPDSMMTAAALVGLALLVGVLGGTLDLAVDSAAPLVVMLALLAVTALARAPLLLERQPGDRRRFVAQQLLAIRAWAPFILLYVTYRALRRTMNVLVDHGVEAQLKALDERLLGVSPSWWFEKIATPWLTDVMSLAYALMFVLPLIILLLLYVRERRDHFREVALALLGAFYLGFALYLLVPARSPRIAYGYASDLVGATGLYELSAMAWDQLQQVTYDAFPSLHTTISTIALWFAARHGDALSRRWPRLLFWLFLPCVVALQISTLYLRQHYFVDLIGGWLLAALVVWGARRLVVLWSKMGRARYTDDRPGCALDPDARA